MCGNESQRMRFQGFALARSGGMLGPRGGPPRVESGLTAPVQRALPPLDILDHLPRLGWATEPTPIQPMPELAAELGLAVAAAVAAFAGPGAGGAGAAPG